jgi:putative methionine-R-sulfoxide reductase with GAF domain
MSRDARLEIQPYAGALAAVDRILNREPEADEVLRQTVAALHERVEAYDWVGILFVEGDELVLGPWAGTIEEGAGELEVEIAYEGRRIGALRAAAAQPHELGETDRAFLERVALLVSAHALVGWDTGGVSWQDVD